MKQRYRKRQMYRQRKRTLINRARAKPKFKRLFNMICAKNAIFEQLPFEPATSYTYTRR